MDKYNKIFSRQECPTSHVFQGYIKGTLSSAETHVFERHLIDCPVCDEVLEGMKMYEARDFTGDLAQLHKGIDKKKENKMIWYAAAATVSILIMSTLLLLNLFEEQKLEFSMKNVTLPPPPVMPAVPSPPVSATDSENKPETYEAYVAADEVPDSAPPASISSPEQSKAPLSDVSEPALKVEEVRESESSLGSEGSMDAISSPEPETKQTDTDSNQLEEVVVMGYGTVKKSDLTGAVSSSKPESRKALLEQMNKQKAKNQDLMRLPYASINRLMQSGKLDSASTELEKLLVKNPNDEDALWLKADVLIRNNLKEEAVKILRRLVDSRGVYAKRARKRMRGL